MVPVSRPSLNVLRETISHFKIFCDFARTPYLAVLPVSLRISCM